MPDHSPARPSFAELLDDHDFIGRHVSVSPADHEHMLATVGVGHIAELIAETVPASILLDGPLDLPPPRSAEDVLADLRRMADANRTRRSLIGLGYYGTVMPPVVQRNVLENPAWYTAYTPYQPEISQGRLETLLTFQTMVADLTGLGIANASLLDEATAAAEAMTMARRLAPKHGDVFFVHHDTHPQTLAVLATRAEPVGIELMVGDVDDLRLLLADRRVFGALLSLPTSSGEVPDWAPVIAEVKASGALVVVATDLLACVLMPPPGALGADIAVGSAQRFGVPMGFGGPHAGFIAAHESAARALPGRLVGVSTDAAGRPALRLALQTREQHIRREKATSNICTAQVLLANIAALYACWHGAEGLRRIAERTHRLTSMVVAGCRQAGRRVHNTSWFDTLRIEVVDAHALRRRAHDLGYDVWVVDGTTIGLSLDETCTLDTVRDVLSLLGVEAAPDVDAPDGLPARREDEILDHEVFRRYRSEHEMLRYLRRLADRDLALDRTMIPLGSCTMKLNATVEMLPITWPGFSMIHPFADREDVAGYLELVARLEAVLVEITGYAAVSLQPNAGSQGEFAGLLAIRAYHRSRGDEQRTVCLIPSSAHGTNAASAVMAGLDVVVVACDERGDVDIADLAAQIERAGDRLAAIMITYPSTHGVFEPAVGDICAMVHDAGGQVYVDGANLNALVGLAKPGRFGADVSHLNLHKTFCIPHGGGGPGVGPVAVGAHLAPFLPGHPLAAHRGELSAVGPVSAAPVGSAGILPIPLAYIMLMGAAGLRQATEQAILSANYLAARLAGAFPVLYANARGRVAHECILDIRPLTKVTGVTVDDIAKRLVDHGFHAPTVSFPVAGTLMVEPTESEGLAELDRFCAAMLSIRQEIADVEQGRIEMADSPLRHAPHTAEDLLGPWARQYSRELGAFPSPATRLAKYFPPVSRIDAAAGDRNLVCSCEPLEAYLQQVVTSGAPAGVR